MAALVVFGKLPNDCRVCQTEPEHRRLWGCDDEIPEGTYALVCPACHGAAKICGTCDGTGAWHLKRCPRAILETRSLRVIDSAVLVEQGVLPGAGGMADQTNWFGEALRYVCAERSAYRKDP